LAYEFELMTSVTRSTHDIEEDLVGHLGITGKNAVDHGEVDEGEEGNGGLHFG